MMTQSLNGSRKRVRGNRDEEGTELPLSKRIHNLRINNGNCCNLDALGHQKHPQPNESEGGGNCDRWLSATQHQQEAGPSGPCADGTDRPRPRRQHPTQATDPWTAALPRYSPDLDASANPFYYDNNRLLYDLYVERMQRCGMI